jgi:hypothetical protein
VKRPKLEKTIQAEIEADLGAEPDLLTLRNSVGEAVYYTESGDKYHVPYGLGVGSPDLVFIKRMRVRGDDHDPPQTFGIWLCMEVKVPGEDATDEQSRIHAIWMRFGAIVDVVHSVEEARAVLERVRRFT